MFSKSKIQDFNGLAISVKEYSMLLHRLSYTIEQQFGQVATKVPVPLRLRSLKIATRLNINLKVISLTTICKLRKQKHA